MTHNDKLSKEIEQIEFELKNKKDQLDKLKLQLQYAPWSLLVDFLNSNGFIYEEKWDVYSKNFADPIQYCVGIDIEEVEAKGFFYNLEHDDDFSNSNTYSVEEQQEFIDYLCKLQVPSTYVVHINCDISFYAINENTDDILNDIKNKLKYGDDNLSNTISKSITLEKMPQCCII